MDVKIKDFFESPEKYIQPNGDVFIIGVAGGSGSEKTFVAEMISKRFDALVIRMDDYYKREENIENKDIPEAFNFSLLKEHIMMLKKGIKIKKSVYTFGLHKDTTEIVNPKKIIVIEGIFALSSVFLDILNFKIFVECSEKIRFERRIKRDIHERMYKKEDIIKKWNETVEPMYKKFVEPQRESADLILNNCEDLKANNSH